MSLFTAGGSYCKERDTRAASTKGPRKLSLTILFGENVGTSAENLTVCHSVNIKVKN